MPRPKATRPKYLHHISGQARVYLDGRYFYLGSHDSPESHARYFALCNEYQANGYKIPDDADTHPGENAPITVECITADYREFAATKYVHDRSRLGRHESLCDLLEVEFGDVPAVEFGPRRLAKLREILIATKNRRGQHNTRAYINDQVRIVVRIFRRAVSQELVPANVLVALQTLAPIEEGDTVANESTEREPVDIEAVRLTARHLSPVLKAMVCIQAATGMRPSEVFRMRPMDIEKRPDGVWVYRPPKHKTRRHKKKKQVPLVGDAKIALKPYMDDRDPTELCFRPAESAQWYLDQRAAGRKTPADQGDRAGYNKRTRAGQAPRQYAEQFNKDNYRRAIERAAKKAGTDHWTPYQLRHTAATVIREALGIEGAQAMLGHSKRQQTEQYARESLDRAIEAAKVAPRL